MLQKQLVNRGINPLTVNFLTYLILSIPCFGFAPRINWLSFPPQFWLYSILAGIFGALGNGFLVRALEKGEISVLGPINAYKSIIGILGGFLLLGEIPSLWGLSGVMMIIYGSYFVLDTKEERFSWKILLRTEIKYRLLALILTAIEAIFVKKITLLSSMTATTISWCLFGTIFSFFFLLLYRTNPEIEIRKIRPGDITKSLYLAMCAGVMLITTIYSLIHLPVGYALSLFQLSSIGGIFLGYHFFNERDIRKKLFGAIVMIAGSVMIILSAA
ncbi:EamA family transporter [Dyadobacter pollutisoli]|uniref:EamA family transporter n=1 Tax=Dyadobacter pollutisoli TaxID=2910158 RepID=A0A9E8NG16_9BACT|nr:EamA family transporter [Dyadobacter pollutisoli]WAC13419.1 EamA family transporter [Dyadobacter pollutisoli]